MEIEQLKIDRGTSGSRTRKKRMSGWTKLLIFLLILGGIGFLFRAKIEGLVFNLTTLEVKVERVVERNASAVAAATGTSANGYIVAKTRAALSADTPGRIVEMNVREGSTVKRGDVVARLYAEEYAASLKRAEAEVNVARAAEARVEADVRTFEKSLAALRSAVVAADADSVQFEAGRKLAQVSLERAQALLAGQVDTIDRVDRAQRDLDEATARVASSKARRDAAAQSVVEGEARIGAAQSAVAEAAARIKSAEAARDLARATLEKTEVRAPFDGIVVLKDAEVGEVVSPNSQGGSSARGSIVTMVDFATLEVQAEVSETSIANVKLNGDARIYLDAYPDKPYAGRVDRIWPTANRTKATVEVRVVFLDRDDKLRPEMGVRVVFVDDAAPARDDDPKILVARDAIVKRDGAAFVFVLEQDRVRERAIKTGTERAGRVAVLDGLVPGDEIVVSPPATLRDGTRVRRQGS
ncbi:MAG: efflux RND transporter periplasmic adaptor subunit [Planctomycetes bacterium]|nr:efflux RND transporter periplasmic adaptor subunit [Planctomycetota bacterium]